VYLLFHDYFLKASIGDAQWKANCLDTTLLTSPIAPPQGEAFAMVLLTNNYFAWLWEAKLHFKDKLKTDYNSPKEIKDMAEISQAFMQCEINLDAVDITDDQEWKLILVTEQAEPIAHEFYQKATMESHTKVRQASRKNPKYKAFKKALDEKEKEEEREGGEDNQENEPSSATVAGEARNKRRKTLKALREYTNPKQDEGRFKGWSSRAADDMTTHVVELSKSTPERDVFNKMYRHVYQKRQELAGTAGRKRKEIVEELINPNYAVDQWGLQDFSAVVQI
jgi:hypothetical protein